MTHNRYVSNEFFWLILASWLAALCLPRAHAASTEDSHFPVCPDGSNGTIETVHLNFGDATDIRDIVNMVDLNPEEDEFQLNPPRCGKAISANLGSPNSIEIYGNRSGREALKRLITSLDLPRQRISMDLWAIQISSASPAKLSDVMSLVQRQVDQTREAMQQTYDYLSKLSLERDQFDQKALKKLEERGFSKVVANDPKLSLTQLLLRLSLAQDPINNYNNVALEVCNFFAGKQNQDNFALYNSFEGRELEAYDIHRIFNDDPPRPYRRPFQGFMEAGLHQRFDANSRQPRCGDGAIKTEERVLLETKAAERRKRAVLNFAKSYSQFKANPTGYDPSELTRTAGIVDGMVTPVVNAINQDIEAYFIRPTLLKIRQIVGRNRGVEYAEFGRSTIAGINGKTVALVSGTTSTFDEPTPLRLSNWLTEAKKFQDKQATSPILPLTQPPAKSEGKNQGSQPKEDTKTTPEPKASPATLGSILPGLGDSNLLSSLPLNNVIALMAALSQEELKWQALSSGIQLKLTPTLTRDQMQATVKINLAIADPSEMNVSLASNEEDPLVQTFEKLSNKRFKSSDQYAKPLSRISKSTLDTKVYVNTMDLFALSSFTNQTSVTGRRWYVPLIGTIWEGAFGDIPVVGGWFSFKRPPQNMQHQSIILTNTLIVPSAMGMASYFSSPTQNQIQYPPDQQYQSPYPIPQSMQIDRKLN